LQTCETSANAAISSLKRQIFVAGLSETTRILKAALYTRDVEAAKEFYAATVGWTFKGMPMPDQNRTYWLAKAADKPVAGIIDMRGIVPDNDPPHWLSYLEVDDIDQMLAKVQGHGGRIVRPPFDVPDFGRIAIGADATGAFMAWVTSKR
jgi:uncharacterized protein